MIIINDGMLLKVFGDMRVNGEGEAYSWAVEELSKRDIYGKDIKYVILYEGCSDPQKYVDNWMRSSVASMEAAEYYNNISNTEDDNMNKYETLLKKYGALYKDFEDYRTVTEALAEEGTYIKNEALAELLEIKDKFNSLYKEHTVYCSAAEDVTVKLIETEKKYDELKNERDALVQEVYHLHDVIRTRQEQCKSLTRERDGIKKENEALYKEFKELKKERENLAQQVVYLNDKMKEKMYKIKQRDKQIGDLIDRNNKKHADYAAVIKERDALKTLYTETAKERDEYEKRLEHINTMSNLDWKFEVVEETETTRSPWDELVEYCENCAEGCSGCPNEVACDGINMGLKPAKWNEDEIAEYNELMAMKEDK